MFLVFEQIQQLLITFFSYLRLKNSVFNLFQLCLFEASDAGGGGERTVGEHNFVIGKTYVTSVSL